MEKDKINFKSNIYQTGGSKVFAIPKELLTFIQADIGDEITLIGEKGTKGKYIAFWKTKGR